MVFLVVLLHSPTMRSSMRRFIDGSARISRIPGLTSSAYSTRRFSGGNGEGNTFWTVSRGRSSTSTYCWSGCRVPDMCTTPLH